MPYCLPPDDAADCQSNPGLGCAATLLGSIGTNKSFWAYLSNHPDVARTTSYWVGFALTLANISAGEPTLVALTLIPASFVTSSSHVCSWYPSHFSRFSVSVSAPPPAPPPLEQPATANTSA